MALSLNFKAYQSDDGKSIVFHETTGGISSATGWDYGTNPTLASIVSAGVDISDVSDLDITTTGTGAIINIVDTGGAITGVTVNTAGSGYWAGQVFDVIAACTTIATVTINTTTSTGGLSTLSITTSGTGYTTGTATLNCPIKIKTLFPDDTDDTQWDFQLDDVYISGVAGAATNAFTDGIYKITYTVYSDTAVEYTKTKYIFCDYSVRCCIRKMFAAISIADCNCDDETVCRAIKVRALWNAVHYAVETGNYTRAKSIYTLIYDLCKQITGCGC